MKETHDADRPAGYFDLQIERLPTLEDFSPEERQMIENDTDIQLMQSAAGRLIDNGQALRVYLCWQDDIMPLLPKTMRAA
jgi:hypothetical protein